MININKSLRLLLTLACLVIIPLKTIAEPNPAAGQLPHPVWETIKSSPSGLVTDESKSQPSSGFVKPPPQGEKLFAAIEAEKTSVKKGELLTFTLRSNQPDLRYYWVSGKQKSTKKYFTVNTNNLDVGRHRVRATVTNTQRTQAHASLFFNVIEEGSDNTNPGDEQAPQNNEAIIELPAVDNTSSDKTPPAPQGENIDNKVIELPVIEDKPQGQEASSSDVLELPPATPVNGSSDNETQQPGKDNQEASTVSESSTFLLGIKPKKLTINENETASFISTVERPDKYQFLWKFADQRSTKPQFMFPTDHLKPGNYSVHLTATNENGVMSKAEAILVINSTKEALVRMPDIIGTDYASLATRLQSKSFKIGRVTERPDDRTAGTILEQEPEAESLHPEGTLVNVVLAATRSKPLVISIQPGTLVKHQGESMVFSAMIEGRENIDDLDYSWEMSGLSAQGRIFHVDTTGLSIGKHTAYLKVTDKEGISVSNSATLEVIEKLLKTPYIIGKKLDDAQLDLSRMGLKLGSVEQQVSHEPTGTVLQQSPSAGQSVASGGLVNLIISKQEEVLSKPEQEIKLTLTADRETVKIGEVVTFQTELDPRPSGSDIHYVYTMNAEKKANIRPVFEWRPNNDGVYSVKVTAFDETGKLAQSNPVSIDVLPAWEMPIAKILPEMQVSTSGNRAEFVSTSTYDLNSSLRYNWSSETGHSGSKKQFAFDTSDIEPGSYTVNLKVIDNQGNSSTSSALLVVQANEAENTLAEPGDKQTVRTPETPSTSQLREPSIHLKVSRSFVSTNTPIKIKVMNDQAHASDLYYFEPGDDDNTQWLTSNEIEHDYKGFGTYLVRAALKKGDKVYYSNSITVWVWSPMLLILTLGIGVLAYLLMWWWTKSLPKPTKNNDKIPPKPPVIEEAIPLSGDTADSEDIVTDSRSTKTTTVTSVLKKALLQFILGVAISILVLYVILKTANLI